jgi:M6 family metalloprotease-like protein
MRRNAYPVKRGALLLVIGILVLGFWGTVDAVRAYEVDTVSEETGSTNLLQAQTVTLKGRINIVNGDPPAGSDIPPQRLVLLTTDTGEVVELSLSAGQSKPVTGQRVEVAGKVLVAAAPQGQGGPPRTIVGVDVLQVIDESQILSPTVSGAVPWVNVLCRFSDSTGEPPHPLAWFDPLFTNTYPGLDHYWRQISYDTVNIAGTMSYGWYTLPNPRSYYVPNNSANLGQLAADCTAAAESDVFFPDYDGINLMFDQVLDCCAWGGGASLNLDGQPRFYRMTWLPPWAQSHSVIAHEMGHGFGLPHSTGPADNPPSDLAIYVSQWDVMSSSSGTCAVSDPQYHCLAPGTIAFHLDEAGWMPPARKAVVDTGETATVTLERLNQPPASGNALMVEVPIDGSSTHFYTVEVRQFYGYDQNVPGQAVVIHDVDYAHSGNGGYAYVVDAVDGNDNVNDAGAMWLPGETFEDSVHNISIEVLSSSGTTFTVYIMNDPALPALAAPNNLGGTGVSRTQIDLAWTDGNTDETQYTIQRSLAGTTSWQTLGTLPGGQTNYTYQNTGLECSETYAYRVRAYRSIDGAYSPFSNVAQVSTQDCLFDPPVMVSPPDGTFTNNNLPIFAWDPSAGATAYQIQIDNNADFSSPLYNQTVAGSTFTPSSALSDDVSYYWRVRATDGSSEHSRWSPVWSVTVGQTRLLAPELRSPKDRSYTPDQTPAFSWKRVKGADSYLLQISGVPDFSSDLRERTVTRAKYTIGENGDTDILVYGIYYWRVRAQNATGDQSQWSAVRAVTLTSLKSPANGDFVTDTTPTFRWKANSLATGYRFQLAVAPTFVDPLVNTPDVTTQYTPDTPLVYGTYYWRVQVFTPKGTLITPAWMVTVTPGVPGKPDLTNPANKWVTDDPGPEFSWEAVPDGYRYQIQIDDQPNFKNPEQDISLDPDALTYAAPLLTQSGTYYWRVRALNDMGVAGRWSSRWSFTLAGPERPVLTSPINKSVTPDAVSFSWAASAGGETYHIQISLDKQFQNVVQETTVPGLTYDAASLADNKYYWRVSAINVLGVAGSWSQVRWFRVDTAGPAAPVLKAPKDQSAVPDTTPVFRWKAVSGAVQYTIQISSDPGFGVVPHNVTTPLTTYEPPSDLAFGTYYWRVRARDGADNWSDWSTPYRVTINLLKSPKGGANVTDTTPRFRWYPVSGAIEYEVQLATDAGFSSLILTQPVSSASYVPHPALDYGLYYWRVRANTGSGFGDNWTPAWQVTITPKPPKKPGLVWPHKRAVINDNTPTFMWKPVTGGHTYHIQVDEDKQFRSPEQDVIGGIGALTHIASELPDGTYYWRVRAINSVGAPGAWSTRWWFTIDTVAPAAPALVSPVDGARVTNKKLRLEWTAVAGAYRYELQLDSNPAFPLPIIANGSKTTYKLPTPLGQAIYYWRVRAVDRAGNASDWSPEWTLNLVAGNTSAPTPEPIVIPIDETPPDPPGKDNAPPVLTPVEPPTTTQPGKEPGR